MHLRLLFLIIVSFCSSQDIALADMSLAKKYFNNPNIVGRATYSYLFWDVYDAELIAPKGEYSPKNQLILTLTYHRAFKGEDIVNKSIEEMDLITLKDESTISQWKSELLKIIPDVKVGDKISGIRNKAGHSIFYFNGSLVGIIQDSQFSYNFFNIWLGKNSSDKEFTSKLLGTMD